MLFSPVELRLRRVGRRVRITWAVTGLGLIASGMWAQCTDIARLSPIAILDNGAETTRLEVFAAGASAVTLYVPAGTPLTFQGVGACGAPLSVPLYDDGTRGDLVPRDGVFTTDGIRWNATASSSCTTGVVTRPAPSLRAVQPGNIEIVRGGVTSVISSTFALWVLPVAEFGIAEPVARLSSEVQVSAHVINVSDPQGRVNRLLSGEPGVAIQDLTRAVYAAVPDVYDFLNFTSTGQRLCTGGKTLGLHVMVKQTWLGTGSLPFDTTASYGSAGKLLGINFIEQQSSDSFAVFAHETMHQWAAYLPPSLGLAGAGGHWSEKTDIAGAVGGGNWTANADGSFWAAPPAMLPRGRLAPLELYLMGLASAAEVAPVQVTDTAPLWFGQGARIMGPVRQVSIAQIQQAAGARIPGPESAQRSFRTAFVVTSPSPLTVTEMTAYDRISRLFTGSLRPRAGNPVQTFAEITGGRATLETSTLPCTFSTSPVELNAAAAGTVGSIAVTASAPHCQWTASSSPGWITISSGGAGVGNGVFTYVIAPHAGPTARSGSVSVAGAVSTQRLPVFQAGSTPFALPVGCAATDAACLNTIVTRTEMAVLVVRAVLGTDQFSYSPAAYFDDVPAGHPHFAWVQKLRELGITSGCGPRQFCAASAVSRGEIAAFLIRARLGISGAQGFPFLSRPYFTDVPMQHQFFGYIQKMREAGITLGCSATEFCPDAPATRWQLGTLLTRAFGVR